MRRNKQEENAGCVVVVGALVVYIATAVIGSSIGGWVKQFLPAFIVVAEILFLALFRAFYFKD